MIPLHHQCHDVCGVCNRSQGVPTCHNSQEKAMPCSPGGNQMCHSATCMCSTYSICMADRNSVQSNTSGATDTFVVARRQDGKCTHQFINLTELLRSVGAFNKPVAHGWNTQHNTADFVVCVTTLQPQQQRHCDAALHGLVMCSKPLSCTD